MNPYFDVFIIFVIILNTVSLALDKFPEFDENTLYVLNVMNFLFTIIFTIEVILKMIGMGVRTFLKVQFNQFDLLIVIISIVEM